MPQSSGDETKVPGKQGPLPHAHRPQGVSEHGGGLSSSGHWPHAVKKNLTYLRQSRQRGLGDREAPQLMAIQSEPGFKSLGT